MPAKARANACEFPAAPIHRRRFIRMGLAAACAFLFPPRLSAGLLDSAGAEKRLAFFNTHTGERLDACYGRAGRYDPAALKEINHVLRDHRTGEVGTIVPGLLDLLHQLCQRLETSQPFHVISGYRSMETNAALHLRNKGVASRSLHVHGMAIDIRVPEIQTTALRDTALALAAGGVGYYPRSDFVHVDIGCVRAW